ncbi:tetratricopeptide repeat protein [Arsenicicoccus piscis]|uniref:Co-chaperone YbbN n=1 Tax=Arsenicicoccus piscis TaxID=673954 RepID=A0ABQ6HP43_9MICO|nr:tetratricopeptide repeat protein [Arsenicicoccus piscis]MCH8628735.1 tetratricopeptide repeat protein [Arsenicicoccus piscis]MCH8629198.1 tetratricopeptide repeat protein [Arsenicicoccus piscis]GMA20230.1 co-chaperone YbbN [Arsenicicoccus piscis]
MTSQPFPGAPLRGAVDLGALAARPQPGAAGSKPAGPAAGGSQAQGGVVVEATDATVPAIMNSSISVPVVLLLWSASRPETRAVVDDFSAVARAAGGRFQLATVDIDANPSLAQALQVQQIPMAIGMLQGQPVPLFVGPQPREVITAYVDELLKIAVSNGITGRVPGAEDAEGNGAEVEPPLPPLIQEAYDAVDRGDLDGAIAAFTKALADNPDDREAQLGLAQMQLLARTQGVDLAQARQAAAERPDDVAAQTMVADLDVLGGHLEDAFTRLIDFVRTHAGDDRDAARLHLIGLFDVIGNDDPRVKKGRTSLMSALF